MIIMKHTGRIPILAMVILVTAIMFTNCKKEINNPGSNNQANGKTTAVFNSSQMYETMTDQDGNVYKTIVIGKQTWMAENLRTTRYRDGSNIPLITDISAWSALLTGAYCNLNNTTNADSIATFGRLYNWNAVTNVHNIAPVGWHIPTSAEWDTLNTCLGNMDSCGGKLKEIGLTHWSSPNTDANNSTGFTALPGGCRNYYGLFDYNGTLTIWWSSTEISSTEAWAEGVNSSTSSVFKDTYNIISGYSVRCIQD
jgi:uncharacterized protein (TIGR02145 family)